MLKADALTFDRQNNASVYKQKADGTFEQVAVEVGVSNGNYVEIKSGVAAGETVYAEGKAVTTNVSMFSGMFGTQVNQPNMGGNNRGNWNSGSNRSNSHNCSNRSSNCSNKRNRKSNNLNRR